MITKMANGARGSSRINANGERATSSTLCCHFAYIAIARIGSDRPSLKDLHDHVVNNVADKWRDLGLQLVRPDQERMLDIIAADHPHDVVSCCKCILKKWLDTTTDATWNELIRALRSPSVQLDFLAGQIEGNLITECKIYNDLYNLMIIDIVAIMHHLPPCGQTRS